MRNLHKEIKENDYKSLAITKIATGVGGLDWSDVKPMLEDSLADLDIPVYIYETYEKGVKATEKH